MPRTPSQHPLVRLNIAMPQPVYDDLVAAQHAMAAASLTEVIRRAAVVYRYLIAEQEAGGTLLVRNGTKSTEIRLV